MKSATLPAVVLLLVVTFVVGVMVGFVKYEYRYRDAPAHATQMCLQAVTRADAALAAAQTGVNPHSALVAFQTQREKCYEADSK